MSIRTPSSQAGARGLQTRDWPFGGVGRRLLLEALLIDDQPDEGWSMSELESKAQVKNGGLKTVFPGAVHLGLVALGEDGRWQVPTKLPAIANPLRNLARAAVVLGDEPIPPLVKRSYKDGRR